MIIDSGRFLRALELGESTADGGIGTLTERLTHRVLKYYFDPDPAHHEIETMGHIADILNDDGVTEIQTRAISRLCPKLDTFLRSYPVTVVLPIPVRRTLCWIDESTGEITKPRAVPRRGRPSDALYELSGIRRFIGNPALTVLVVLFNAADCKLLNGTGADRKHGAHRLERTPTQLLDVITLRTPSDYSALIPTDLPPEFTAAEWSKATNLKGRRAYYSLKLLCDLGVLTRRAERRAYIYSHSVAQSGVGSAD